MVDTEEQKQDDGKYANGIPQKQKAEEAEPEVHPGGRPTKYNDTMPQRVEMYLEKCVADDVLPTHAGLAVFLKVCKATVENWAKQYPEFLVSLGILNAIQEVTLVNRGLKSEYNSTICKLMLSSNHGYKERSDTTSGDEPIKPQSVDFTKLLDTLKKEKQETDVVAE